MTAATYDGNAIYSRLNKTPSPYFLAPGPLVWPLIYSSLEGEEWFNQTDAGFTSPERESPFPKENPAAVLTEDVKRLPCSECCTT